LPAVAFGSCQFAGGIGKVFRFMVLVLGKSFRSLVALLGPQVFGRAWVFMFKVILPESHNKVYYGRVGSPPQWASLQVHAQQGVQPAWADRPTGGSRRVFGHFSTPEGNPALKVLSRPAHQRLTLAVRRSRE